MFSLLPNNRKWLAPITLTRKKPIAQLIVGGTFAQTALFQPQCDFAYCLPRWEPIDHRRINSDAIANESNRIFFTRRLHNRANGEVELSREFQVAHIVRGYGHNRAGAVAEQNVICNPDWDSLVIDRINCVPTGKNPGFFFG